MLRIVARRVGAVARKNIAPRSAAVAVQNVRASHDGPQETEEEFNQRYVSYLQRPSIDPWEYRGIMNNLIGMDVIPDPVIICAALKACRKMNDIGLAIRTIEAVKDKCGYKANQIFPYIMQEIKPTMDELGINTLEELGYDKPELALESPYDIH